jgi:hypothetical protein
MHLWVEQAGGEWKYTNVEQKTVTLIYLYPFKPFLASMSRQNNNQERYKDIFFLRDEINFENLEPVSDFKILA